MFDKRIGSRAEVFHGKAEMTDGGLKKKDLVMKDGRIMSKAMVKRGQSPALKKWRKAVAQAKAKMGKDGFVLVKGKLLEEARKIYKKM
jgi:predicted secreted protein